MIKLYKKTIKNDGYFLYDVKTNKESNTENLVNVRENETVLDHRILDDGTIVLLILRGDPSSIKPENDTTKVDYETIFNELKGFILKHADYYGMGKPYLAKSILMDKIRLLEGKLK